MVCRTLEHERAPISPESIIRVVVCFALMECVQNGVRKAADLFAEAGAKQYVSAKAMLALAGALVSLGLVD